MIIAFRDLVLSENPYQDEVSVHVASQDAVSFIRRYYDEGEGKIYPYLTAILDVTDGIVNGIAWDDSCVRCKNNKKENNTRCEEVSIFLFLSCKSFFSKFFFVDINTEHIRLYWKFDDIGNRKNERMLLYKRGVH